MNKRQIGGMDIPRSAGNLNITSIKNDVSNMEDAFSDQYNADPGSTIYTSATGSRSTQDLKDMIRDACNGLQGGQLVLYFGDHGDRHFDADEFWNDLMGTGGTGIPVDPELGWGVEFEVPEGWVSGLQWMDEKPDEVPEPTFDITSTTELMAAEWTLWLNGIEIPLVDLFPGESASVPVPWDIIHVGPNLVELMPTFPGPGPLLELENLELSSGPIAMRLRPDVIPEPGSLALWLLGCAGLARRKRRR